MNTHKSIVIELTVNNHPGVMSHITGLFARRAFNLEGILCGALKNDPGKSSMYLLVNFDACIDQILKQLEKLYDVLSITVREDYDLSIFSRLHEFISVEATATGNEAQKKS